MNSNLAKLMKQIRSVIKRNLFKYLNQGSESRVDSLFLSLSLNVKMELSQTDKIKKYSSS